MTNLNTLNAMKPLSLNLTLLTRRHGSCSCSCLGTLPCCRSAKHCQCSMDALPAYPLFVCGAG